MIDGQLGARFPLGFRAILERVSRYIHRCHTAPSVGKVAHRVHRKRPHMGLAAYDLYWELRTRDAITKSLSGGVTSLLLVCPGTLLDLPNGPHTALLIRHVCRTHEPTAANLTVVTQWTGAWKPLQRQPLRVGVTRRTEACGWSESQASLFSRRVRRPSAPIILLSPFSAIIPVTRIPSH